MEVRANGYARIIEEGIKRGPIRQHVAKNRPFGNNQWQKRINKRLGLESTLRPCGRPEKKKAKEKKPNKGS